MIGQVLRVYYENNVNGLTSMILDDEYFAIFYIRILRVKGYHDVMMCQRAPKFEISINLGKIGAKLWYKYHFLVQV